MIIPSQIEIERVRQKYQIPEKKLARIFNPIDVNSHHAIDRQEARKILNLLLQNTIVVWHGRVEIFRKGLDILLGAWEIIQNRSLRQRLGKSAQHRIENYFSLPAVGQQLKNLLAI